MSRFFWILLCIMGITGCQGISPMDDRPSNWNQLSFTEKQAWLDGYYWGSRNFSMWWDRYSFSPPYYYSGWGWSNSSNHHASKEDREDQTESRFEPQENRPSEPAARSEPPHTLSSESIQCGAENSCKQFRPR